MMQLLIVDDEIHAVRGIRAGVEWDLIGFLQVQEAYNVRQAKEIFATQKIDIMICDIEMPEGDGFELLAWVKEYYPETGSIFLTCHADFEFAQKAIQLGSLDYLLKPVRFAELEKAILKAVSKLKKERDLIHFNETYKHYYHFWDSADESQTIVEKVKRYIDQHIHEDISREDIASNVHLNADYLTRLFKKETGLNISEYVLQERINMAKKMLTTTGLTVGSIAAIVGYHNFSHFSKMFKKATNFSPKEYRRL